MTEEPKPASSPGEEKLDSLRARQQSGHARYEKGDEIGRGGMGAVLRVRDLDLGRDLAMKVIAQRAMDPEVVQRFLDEAQITGQLDHPGVVPVHELGVDAEGKAWFTMRLVKGDTADVVFGMAREERDGWTRTRALEVILKVCDTMAFAHRKGVLHRDLKPSNVMVGKFGEVYVMDWGLAKVMGQTDRRDLRPAPHPSTMSKVRTERSKVESDSDSPVMTMDGAVVGTPCYMSLEQAEGRVELLDQRADVYAIGAMLYELLTGRQPYVSPGARVSPYAVLAAVQAGPPIAVHRLDKTVPAELVAICDKAMERDLAKRYPDVKSLSEDLRAYVDKRVVRAYRTGAFAELSMWVRRNKALAAALMIGTLGIAGLAWRAQAIAQQQRQQLVEASWGAFNQADRLFLAAHDEKSLSKRLAGEREGLLQLARALVLDPGNRVAWQRFVHEILRFASFGPARENVRLVHEAPVHFVAFGPDGRQLLTTCGRSATVWDPRTSRKVSALHHEQDVDEAMFDALGQRVVTRSGSVVRVWDPVTGRRLHDLGHRSAVSSASFSPDAERILTVSREGMQLWDARSGDRVSNFPAPSTRDREAVFSPDGLTFVTVGGEDGADIWSLSTSTVPRHVGTGSHFDSAAFSPDGSRMVTMDGGGAWLWDAASWSCIAKCEHSDAYTVHFSPDGTRFLTAPDGREVIVWDASSGERVCELNVGHYVAGVAFSSDGTRVVTASENRTATTWEVPTGRVLSVVPHAKEVWCAAFSPDGGQFATACGDGVVRVWDAGLRASTLRVALGHACNSVSLDGAAERLVTVCHDGAARVYDLRSGREIQVLRHEIAIKKAILSSDGKSVVTNCDHGPARVWSINENETTVQMVLGTEVTDAGFSRDGRQVYTVSGDTAVVWDVSLGDRRRDCRHERAIRSASFNFTGNVLTTVGEDWAVRIWDVSGTVAPRVITHDAPVETACCSPDGSHVVTVSGDDAVIWDLREGGNVGLRVDRQRILDVCYSEDGTRVLTSGNTFVRVWDAKEATALWETAPPDSFAFNTCEFGVDGMHVLTSSYGAGTMLWDIGSGKRVAWFLDRRGEAYALSQDGGRVAFATMDGVVVYDLGLAASISGAVSARDVPLAVALAEIVTCHTLSRDSELHQVSGANQERNQAIAESTLSLASALEPLVQWLMGSSHGGFLFPQAEGTGREWAETHVDAGTSESVREALYFDPGHPLVHIALAAHEVPADSTDPGAIIRRDFLRDHDLKRLPADAAICARAAKMLLAQNDKDRARIAADKALAIDPKNETALRVRDEVNR